MWDYPKATLETIKLLQSKSKQQFMDGCKRLSGNDLQAAIWHRCAADLELFAAYYFPHLCSDPFNQFHRDTFQDSRFMERSIRRARGAPRGYAKSVHRALIKPLHDACYGLERFIVILSNTEDQAIQKLKDIRNEVLQNTLLVRDYALRFSASKVNASEFEIYAGSFCVKFKGYGSGAQIRGIRFGAYRPTKIILDDVEHSEEVFNEALRSKYENWFHEDVVKSGHKSVNIELIGTVLHRESLLKKLLQNPMYDGRIYKSVVEWPKNQELWAKWKDIICNLDNDNRIADSDAFYLENKAAMDDGAVVLWPEKETLLQLMKEMIEMGYRSFMKEKQNEPLGADDKVFSTFHWYRETVQNNQPGVLIEKSNVFIPFEAMRAYGVIDPSTGQTKARKGKLGDYTCILSGYTDSRNRLFVHRDWTKREPPTKQIQQIFESHEIFNYEKFGVETNLYRNLLLPNIQAERERREKSRSKQIRLPLYDIEQVENKEKRIYTLEPKVTNGWILLNRALSPEFVNQIDDFPHASHDDCPDALEMLFGLVNNRYRMSDISLNPMSGR